MSVAKSNQLVLPFSFRNMSKKFTYINLLAILFCAIKKFLDVVLFLQILCMRLLIFGKKKKIHFLHCQLSYHIIHDADYWNCLTTLFKLMPFSYGNFQPWRIYSFGDSSGVAWASCWSCIVKLCRPIWKSKCWNQCIWWNCSTEVYSKATEDLFPASSSWIFVLASQATGSHWIRS